MRAKKIGIKLTEEHRAKIGAKSKGNAYAKGVTHTDEWKKMMSERMTGRNHTWGDKVSKARMGMTFTSEHRANMSLATKKMWEDPEFRKQYYTSRGLPVPMSLSNSQSSLFPSSPLSFSAETARFWCSSRAEFVPAVNA